MFYGYSIKQFFKPFFHRNRFRTLYCRITIIILKNINYFIKKNIEIREFIGDAQTAAKQTKDPYYGWESNPNLRVRVRFGLVVAIVRVRFGSLVVTVRVRFGSLVVTVRVRFGSSSGSVQ